MNSKNSLFCNTAEVESWNCRPSIAPGLFYGPNWGPCVWITIPLLTMPSPWPFIVPLRSFSEIEWMWYVKRGAMTQNNPFYMWGMLVWEVMQGKGQRWWHKVLNTHVDVRYASRQKGWNQARNTAFWKVKCLKYTSGNLNSLSLWRKLNTCILLKLCLCFRCAAKIESHK